MDQVEFASLGELIAQVMPDTPSEEPTLWFRGHGSHEHKLVPKLYRGRTDRPKEQIYRREARLLARFRERSLPFWPAGYPQGDWEHLFSMQHHGIPTRLLDWSENLLVAAYFAASDDNAPNCRDGSDPKPTIWTLDPIGWNSRVPQLEDTGVKVLTVADEIRGRWEPVTSEAHLGWRAKYPVAIYGVHNSERIVAQRGTFTIAGESQLGMEDIGDSGDQWEGLLTKYVYNGNREQFRAELRYIGFTESMIFPDLSSLSAELTQLEGWQ